MDPLSPSDTKGPLPSRGSCRSGSSVPSFGDIGILEASDQRAAALPHSPVGISAPTTEHGLTKPTLPQFTSPSQDLTWSGTLSCVDWYSIGTAAALWHQGRADCGAVFEAFFREAPFNGAFAALGGVEDVIELVRGFKIEDEQLDFIRQRMPGVDDGFLKYLKSLDGRLLEVKGKLCSLNVE